MGKIVGEGPLDCSSFEPRDVTFCEHLFLLLFGTASFGAMCMLQTVDSIVHCT